MARKNKFTPYGEEIVETFDEDAGSSEFMSYQFGRSSHTNDDFFPDDPVPLFLSGQVEESKRPALRKTKDKGVMSSLPLKTTVLVASAAVIVFSVLAVENPLTLFANAKASLISISAGPLSPSTPAIQAAVEVRTVPVAVKEAPTRDEIAAAFRAAHQSQPEIIRQPPPAAQPAAAPPARRLSADELAALMKRAKNLIAVGDIAPARLLLERAADAQEASAALLLAQTYDPVVLGTPDTRSITPDPAMARGWYEKAAKFGSADAQQRLAQMQN
jgi:hypothetical protein